MFKKVVSQLSFSPATIEHVASYARSVRRRQRLHGQATLALGALLLTSFIPLILSSPSAEADPTPANQLYTNDSLSYTHTADSSLARSGQLVTWQLSVSNPSDGGSITDDVWFSTQDISDYATVTSASNHGIVSEGDHRILWPDLHVKPGETVTLTVTARVDSRPSETAHQAGYPESHDCKITTSFGTTQNVNVDCPPMKQLEAIMGQLPQLPPVALPVVYGILLTLNLIAYFALRLRSKELRIIRTQLNTGGF